MYEPYKNSTFSWAKNTARAVRFLLGFGTYLILAVARMNNCRVPLTVRKYKDNIGINMKTKTVSKFSDRAVYVPCTYTLYESTPA